jgi:hypothetical protein
MGADGSGAVDRGEGREDGRARSERPRRGGGTALVGRTGARAGGWAAGDGGIIEPMPAASRRIALALLVAALAGAPAGADVITLKDGSTLEGEIVSKDDSTVVVETTFDGRKEVLAAQVKSIDTSSPPLRKQLAFRLERAADVPSLVALADWAKGKGFRPELEAIWQKVLALDPAHVRAHKALGHVLVGKRWLTPEEKAEADRAAAEAANRAKGLVPHEGRWVTPAEKEALEKGLVKDGDDWITEDELHRRRGETKVDGTWIRVGDAEAKARGAALSKEMGLTLKVEWAPHVDLFHELEPADAAEMLSAAEKTARAFDRLMKPGPEDRLDGVRVALHVFQKAPTYARFCEAFAKEAQVAEIGPAFAGWAKQAGRVPGFLWPKPGPTIGVHVFPFRPEDVASRVAHMTAQGLLGRYRHDYRRMASPWLSEGFAYVLELEARGTTSTYTSGRAGIAGGGDPGPWMDVKRWKDALKVAVAASQDTPAPRLFTATEDQIQLPDLVKSWSLVDHLIRLDRAKWKLFVDRSKERETTDEDALRAAYGIDARALESRWRAWVEKGFVGP